ncbi:MAG TPA: FapA family protein [Desulfotignum sp.]|nr:FapA family protein [Desulfotignum sp.]
MTDFNTIPTLAWLALEYGTIQQDQYRQITALYTLRQKQDPLPDYADLLLGQGFATRYQVGLLQLIQEYHVIKHLGEQFGKIAIEKGFATKDDVRKALEHQKKEFRRARIKKLIGDILVESQVITLKQKQEILKEQAFLEHLGGQIYSQAGQASSAPDQKKTGIPLSEYERQFLQIKALDREFAAAVLEKNLASQRDVAIAQKVQEDAFEASQPLKALEDVMVDMGMLTQRDKHLILAELHRSQQNDQAIVSANIQVYTSPDKTEAGFIIAKEDLDFTSLETLTHTLAAAGITHGIYPDAILQAHLERKDQKFPAAKTDFSTTLMRHTQATCLLDTDETVPGQKRKGEILMTQTPGPDTYLKTDVFGKKRQKRQGTDFTFQCGGNTRSAQNGLGVVAAKTGVPGLSLERKLFIYPKIHVLEDADLRYGPLEAYADLSISGILFGAYPVTAGKIIATEIRDATIEAMGDITASIGITDTVIRSQGDIHARYLHNCRIETFGNIYVKNEIIDCVIRCSGKIDAGQCRVISSTIHAKKGIVLRGIGSQKTRSCIIAAGSEHHITALGMSVQQKIHRIKEKLTVLENQKKEQEQLEKKIFQKMVELKLFHDRAKYKKTILEKEWKKINTKAANEKNISKLIKNFEHRMKKSIASLKELNAEKKQYQRKMHALENEINALRPQTEKHILSLQQTQFSFYEWARADKNIPKISISGKAFQGTQLRGIFSGVTLSTDMENFFAAESEEKNGHAITLTPLH